ncbi:MAG: efflux transporter outer membrane subunit [Candidatus Berkiella sp.]
MKKPSHTLLGLFLVICGCTVGPDYVKPHVEVPVAFKEATPSVAQISPPKGWKMAQPEDDAVRGSWWIPFHDPVLNALICQVAVSNQNIMQAEAQYRQALALVNQTRAGFFPTVSSNADVSRSKTSTFNNLNSESGSNSDFGDNVSNNYRLTFDATWEPDLWGSLRRNVEANRAAASASFAELALTTLSMQATLAQTYFQLRGLDGDQRVLDNTLHNYQKLLKITRNRYDVGVASKGDVLQVQSQLEQAEVAAIDNRINRAVYEHAIAVLIGMPPAHFSLPPCDDRNEVPSIPVEVPSTLLERRPDIAQAERLVAEANAQIGVAIAAYFPVLTLSGNYGWNTNHFPQMFSGPASLWSLGSQLAQTLFDAGARWANVQGTKANYDATVANYRQVVLSAFQEVEDNLATLRILEKELKVQQNALQTARQSLQLVMNEYQAGTKGLTDVLLAEVTVYTAEKNTNDIEYRRFIAAVGLIKAMGGGWDFS